MKIFSTPNRFFIAAAFVVLAAFSINLLFDTGHAQLRPDNSPWPIFRGDAGLTGRAKVIGPKIPEPPRIIRPPQTIAKEMLSPILPEEQTVVYTFRNHRTIYIEHLKSGQNFKFDAGEFNASPVAGKNGVVYAGSTDSWLYAIDTRSGEKLWSLQPRKGDPITSSANVSADGTIIYVVTDGGFFCAFRNDGTPQIEPLFLGRAGKGVTPAIDANGRVYVANGPEVYVFRSTGSILSLSKAMRHSESGNFEWVATSANIVFAGSSKTPFVTAFDADNGQTLWKSDDPALSSAGKPAISLEGRLYLVGAENDEKKLKALDIRNGEELSSNNRAPFTGMPVIDALGRIYLVARVDQSVHDFFCFEPDRKELWSPIRLPLSYDGFLRESPAFGADGAIYIPGYGELYVVRPEPPHAARLERVSGDQQKGCAGSTLALPLRVRVRDQYDGALANHRVDFRPVAGNGRVNPSTVFTNADGIAETYMTLGTDSATQEIEAKTSFRGQALEDLLVVFTATMISAQLGGKEKISFPRISIKETLRQNYVVYNAGDCAAALQLEILNDPQSSFYICEPAPGRTLLPRDSAKICLQFAPKFAGSHTATLRISNALLNNAAYEVALSGAGFTDTMPPGAPIRLALAESYKGWRNQNKFILTWTNPFDSSGIAGAYYKVGERPTSNDKHNGFIPLTGLPKIEVSAPLDSLGRPQPGKHAVYVWLKDGFDNADFNHLAVDTIRFDNVPPALIHVPPDNLAQIGQPVPIKVETSDNFAQMESATLFYRSGGELSFTAQSLDIPKAVTAIPSHVITMNGAAYYIIAKDRAGNVTRFPETDGLYQPVHVAIAAEALPEKRHDRSTGTSANGLRSFPLIFPATFAQDILGAAFKLNDPELFRLRDIDSSSVDSLRPLHEYPRVQKFAPGNAMFLISRNNVVLKNPRGSSANTGAPYVIRLRPGWNLVASPFYFAIPFQNSSLRNFLNHAYTYEGAWQPVTPAFQFKPWEGLAIKVHDDDTSKQLVIWPVAEAMSPPGSEKTLSGSREASWSISIKAFCATTKDTVYDAPILAGVAAGAEVKWDPYEQLKTLPIESAYVAVYFPQRQWPKHADFYATDFRPPSADGQEWRFEVQSIILGQVIQLNFDVRAVPPEYDAVLIDETLSQPVEIDLRRRPVYRFRYPAQKRARHYSFRLLARKGAIADKRPAKSAVTRNFPNPFNAATTIQFSLPNPTRVSLRIYNLNGELVRALIKDEETPAGIHTAVWDGRNERGQLVTSGEYFYWFKAAEFEETQKLLFIK